MKVIRIIKHEHKKIMIYNMLYELSRLIFMFAVMCTFLSVISYFTSGFDHKIVVIFSILMLFTILMVPISICLFIPDFISRVLRFNKLIKNITLMKSRLVSSRFVNVYYLVILKSKDLLTIDEYNIKKDHLLGKTYFSTDNFYLLAKYKNYLEISDVEFNNKKQEFLHNGDTLSFFELRRLIKINAISKDEAKPEKLNYTHYYLTFIVIYLIFGICIFKIY